MKLFTFIAGIIAVIISASSAYAAKDPIYTGTFSNKAVGGYDVTTYYTGDKPVKGSKEFKTKYKGADWFFVNQENLDKFVANPEKFEPQYGGYCAWAVAHNNLVKGDPLTWHIDDGKLYLNYDQSIADSWLPRKAELIEKGDKKFPELLNSSW